ncbi:MAG: lysine--tRNA ligase [Polyangiaceae bacterium]|nr:lysine--tRNA ligase [Polyangiaceae bacterium]
MSQRGRKKCGLIVSYHLRQARYHDTHEARVRLIDDSPTSRARQEGTGTADPRSEFPSWAGSSRCPRLAAQAARQGGTPKLRSGFACSAWGPGRPRPARAATGLCRTPQALHPIRPLLPADCGRTRRINLGAASAAKLGAASALLWTPGPTRGKARKLGLCPFGPRAATPRTPGAASTTPRAGPGPHLTDDRQTLSGEEALIASRRAKAARIRERGDQPFANDIDTGDRTLVSEIRRVFAEALLEPPQELRYDAERVSSLAGATTYHVAGRLMARRGFGKASFLVLRDASGEMQLFAKKDILGDKFGALEDLDLGDVVEARGQPMATRQGELSLQLSEVRLLTKAMRPLPEKWHGLTDVDLRYRRRYIDLVANPEVASVLVARAAAIQGLRRFLDDRGFLEVETPTLHSLIGGAAARPFMTHHNTLDLELYLRIAPELYLKRLLVGGFERVYEIGRCYRNEGLSTRHNPEFTMLEFYQAYARYETLMQLAEELMREVDAFVGQRLSERGLGAEVARWHNARTFSFDEAFARVPLREAVERSLEKAGLPIGLLARLEAVSSGESAFAEVMRLRDECVGASARARGFDWAGLGNVFKRAASSGERRYDAYEYLAEPFLCEDYRTADGRRSVPVFIMDYPAEVSPLARRNDRDRALVDRFELFVDGRELGNAFSELNDPDDQAARFRDQLEQKRRGSDEAMDFDEDYIRALEHGMPPAAGFGMGVDRLAMTLTGQTAIRDVIAFPLLRQDTVSR